MRIGIMGGTFDPIHYGHLFVAEEARVRFHLENILFIPNAQPPHKSAETISPARDRFAMTSIATHSNPKFACSRLELDRSGLSYTVDTLRQLRKENPEAELFYITGLDAVADILSWRCHEEVIQLAVFIAATRPGFDPMALRERLPREYLERILLLESTTMGISSTDIRERIQNGLPTRYLLPDPVLDYIFKHRLYTNSADRLLVTPSTTAAQEITE